MVDQKRFVELINQFGDDEELNKASREELRSMGRDVIKMLYSSHFQTDGQKYTEIYKTFATIGNDQFSTGGVENIEKVILKAMQSGANKARLWADDEVYTLSVNTLTAWGVELPPIKDQKINVCHVCGKKLSEERILICGLHNCEKSVCREHAHIIETSFGKFNGSGGIWFCSEEHYKHANHNHIDWN